MRTNKVLSDSIDTLSIYIKISKDKGLRTKIMIQNFDSKIIKEGSSMGDNANDNSGTKISIFNAIRDNNRASKDRKTPLKLLARKMFIQTLRHLF